LSFFNWGEGEFEDQEGGKETASSREKGRGMLREKGEEKKNQHLPGGGGGRGMGGGGARSEVTKKKKFLRSIE